MKADDRGVAGFFEDLPVLMFILAGVASLVLAGAISSRTAGEARRQTELDEAACSLAERLVSEICGGPDSGGRAPSLASIAGTNLQALAIQIEPGCTCSISLACLHPEYEWLYGSTGTPDEPGSCGYADLFFDAIGESGLVMVLELKVLVWEI